MLLVSATLETSCWPWAVEYASEVVRVKALKPQVIIIRFEGRVVAKLIPCGKNGSESHGAYGGLQGGKTVALADIATI